VVLRCRALKCAAEHFLRPIAVATPVVAAVTSGRCVAV